MSISSIFGLFSASAVVIIAIFLGGNPSAFLDAPSFLIVVGGTIFAVMVRFKVWEFIDSFKVIGLSIAGSKEINCPDEMIMTLGEIARFARQKGVIGLSSYEINHRFLKVGLNMIADGYSAEIIKESLENSRRLQLVRLQRGASVWESIGDVAPAFGMIGTLVGLIQMLSNLNDPSSIGPAMAVAMLTTLYGALFANLIAIPLADKIKQHALNFDEMNELIVEGVKMIKDGIAPAVIEDALKGFSKEKLKVAEAG